MGDNAYRKTLEAARSDLANLLAEQKRINEKIGKLAPVIQYLAQLCDEPVGGDLESMAVGPDLGLTDAIRFVLKAAAGRPVPPTEVRDLLAHSGFNLAKYANPLPPIHNTLKRLKESKEIEEIEGPTGKAYRWVSEYADLLAPMPLPETYLPPMPKLKKS